MGSSALPNHGVVTLAVYLLGGDRNYIDTEDIAIKANELAPRRFSWHKHPEQINLEIVRVYLSDAKKKAKGEFLSGSGTAGWILTENGLAYAERMAQTLDDADLSRKKLSPSQREWRSKERNRILNHPAYTKLKTNGLKDVPRLQAEDLFRIDDYVLGQARSKKINRLLDVFQGDPELEHPIRQLATIVQEGS